MPDDASVSQPIVEQHEEPYVATPPYRAPHEHNVQVGPLSVSTGDCPRCGAAFAWWGTTTVPDVVLADDPAPLCWRCRYVPLTVPAEVAAVMSHVRWKLDEYRKAAGLGGIPREEFRRTALAASQACWIHGPALLAALEAIYGDQQVTQVQAIATGNPP